MIKASRREDLGHLVASAQGEDHHALWRSGSEIRLTAGYDSCVANRSLPCSRAQINDTMSSIIVAQLLFLESDNPEKNISMYINSPGGVVTAGLVG